jgi:hypothetical protein
MRYTVLQLYQLCFCTGPARCDPATRLCNDLMYCYCSRNHLARKLAYARHMDQAPVRFLFVHLRITVSYAQSATSLLPAAACQSRTPPPASLRRKQIAVEHSAPAPSAENRCHTSASPTLKQHCDDVAAAPLCLHLRHQIPGGVCTAALLPAQLPTAAPAASPAQQEDSGVQPWMATRATCAKC